MKQNTNSSDTTEEPTKLNWIQRKVIKKLMKTARKRILAIGKEAESCQKDRDNAIKAIKELRDVFEIKDENGKEVTDADLETMELGNLMELLSNICEEGTKLI